VQTRHRRAWREPTPAVLRAIAFWACLGALVVVPTGVFAGAVRVAWIGDPKAHGFAPKTDAGAPCAHAGATASAQAGTIASFGACFFIFNSPGSATITSVNVIGRFNKASTSENLCTQSFADVGSPAPLNQCLGGDFNQTGFGPLGEIGLRNKFGAPIDMASANANNVNLASGIVNPDDPPGLLCFSAGQIPAWVTDDSVSLNWSASDPESSIAAASYQTDGAAPVGLLGDGCQDVFVCGATPRRGLHAGRPLASAGQPALHRVIRGQCGRYWLEFDALRDRPHSARVHR
jgi:hypothetical protein